MLFLKEFIIYKSKYDNIIICLFLGFLILIDFVIIVFFCFFFGPTYNTKNVCSNPINLDL